MSAQGPSVCWTWDAQASKGKYFIAAFSRWPDRIRPPARRVCTSKVAEMRRRTANSLARALTTRAEATSSGRAPCCRSSASERASEGQPNGNKTTLELEPQKQKFIELEVFRKSKQRGGETTNKQVASLLCARVSLQRSQDESAPARTTLSKSVNLI